MEDGQGQPIGGWGVQAREIKGEPSRLMGMDQEAAVPRSGYVELLVCIQRLRGQADQLEALAHALPRELNPAANEALWQLAQKIGR